MAVGFFRSYNQFITHLNYHAGHYNLFQSFRLLFFGTNLFFLHLIYFRNSFQEFFQKRAILWPDSSWRLDRRFYTASPSLSCPWQSQGTPALACTRARLSLLADSAPWQWCWFLSCRQCSRCWPGQGWAKDRLLLCTYLSVDRDEPSVSPQPVYRMWWSEIVNGLLGS